jgi:enediyne biosynthesis protein E4
MATLPTARWPWLSPSIALAIVSVLYFLSLEPVLPEEEAEALAGRFSFAKLPLPELDGLVYKTGPGETVRSVHPSLHHIRSWISFVGAAVSLADLDGDGLPNDLVSVDPRVDRVIVAPVPGRTPGFRPFALDPSPLPFDRATMAPMGTRVGDFDEDGNSDILAYFWGRSPILFLQRPGPEDGKSVLLSAEKFVAVELVSPSQVWFTSAVGQADLDGDGHVDLFIGNYNPDGTRVLDGKAPGIEDMMHSMSRAYNGGADRLFLQDGPRGDSVALFREAGDVLEPDVARGWTFAVGAADLDGDLLPEIYLAQDFGPDRLLHNRSKVGRPEFARLEGRRSFTTPRSLVVGADSFSSMGVDFGDLNGDGWPDLFVSNVTCDFAIHESNFAFMSTGRTGEMRQGIAPYENRSEALGLSRSGWAWDVKFADFDNDGELEVVQAAGFTKGSVNKWPEMHELALGNDGLIMDPRTYHHFEPGDDLAGQDHDSFFVKARDGRYFDIATRIGLGTPMLSRGIATADVDGDGRLDFAVANNWEPSFFFQNVASDPGSFLGLHLRLPVGPGATRATVVHPGPPRRAVDGRSRPAIGATATVHRPDGRRLTAQVDGGNGHSGQRSPDLHFGLGKAGASTPVEVDIRWRDGGGRVRSETLSLEPNRWHTILLGEPKGTTP